MSDGEALTEPVPPASRLGAVLGWGLPALGVACFIASLQIDNSAEAAWRTAQTLPENTAADVAAYDAAFAAYHQATFYAHLLPVAGFLSLLVVPGLLCAKDPSLLGGPFGRFVRWNAPNVAPRRSHRRHPVTFYQGFGLALPGIGGAICFLGLVATLDLRAPWEVIVATGLAPLASVFLSMPLNIEGGWWFKSGWRRL